MSFTPAEMWEMAEKLTTCGVTSFTFNDATYKIADIAAMLRYAADALEAKGETTGERILDQYAAAPPLAPSSEPFDFNELARDFIRKVAAYPSMLNAETVAAWFRSAVQFHALHYEAPASAPREPQPSSDYAKDILAAVQSAYGTNGRDYVLRAFDALHEKYRAMQKPSSGASVPQMLSVHPSHVMETQRASKMASCVNCDRPLDWPCDANNPREASAPQTEEQIAFTAGWNAAKRDSDAADDEDIADAPDVAFKEVE